MEDERLFEELPPLPEETSFPEHTMLPEYTPVYPDASFFQESAVTAREENIFHGQTPEGEEALIRSTRKFMRRFAAMEKASGDKLPQLSLDEMIALWDQAKKQD